MPVFAGPRSPAARVPRSLITGRRSKMADYQSAIHFTPFATSSGQSAIDTHLSAAVDPWAATTNRLSRSASVHPARWIANPSYAFHHPPSRMAGPSSTPGHPTRRPGDPPSTRPDPPSSSHGRAARIDHPPLLLHHRPSSTKSIIHREKITHGHQKIPGRGVRHPGHRAGNVGGTCRQHRHLPGPAGGRRGAR